MGHDPFNVHRQVVSISGAASGHAAEVCNSLVPSSTEKKPTVESFHLQSIDKVDDALLVVQRQVPAGQEGDVLVVPHQTRSHDLVEAGAFK